MNSQSAPSSSGSSTAADGLLYWETGSIVKVRFESPVRSWQKEAVEKHAKTWTEYANLTFRYEKYGPFDMLISFNSKDSSWSKVGRGDCHAAIEKGRPSMNLGLLKGNDEHNRRKVLHEFGHALGMFHEHQSPYTVKRPEHGVPAELEWNINNIRKNIPAWNDVDIQNNILSINPNAGSVKATGFDRESIMLYPFYPDEVQTPGGLEGIPNNTWLSTKDKQFVSLMYPGRDNIDLSNYNVPNDAVFPSEHSGTSFYSQCTREDSLDDEDREQILELEEHTRNLIQNRQAKENASH